MATKINMGTSDTSSGGGCYCSNEWLETIAGITLCSAGLTAMVNGVLAIFHFHWYLILMGCLYFAFGFFASIAESSAVCICFRENEWYRNLQEKINLGHFRKFVVYLAIPIPLLILISIRFVSFLHFLITAAYAAGAVMNYIIYKRTI